MVNACGILIQSKYVAPFSHQVDQVASETASSIEHAHAGRNVSTQNLIEDININLPELLLYAQGHCGTFSKYRDLEWKTSLAVRDMFEPLRSALSGSAIEVFTVSEE
jgi:hypothetical protein